MIPETPPGIHLVLARFAVFIFLGKSGALGSLRRLRFLVDLVGLPFGRFSEVLCISGFMRIGSFGFI